MTIPMVKPQYSVIIPAYNESARIASTLGDILRVLDHKGWNAEVIVVDDGSHDNTKEIVKRFIERDRRVQLIENRKNSGKGYSVRNGLLHGAGNIVMFTDADLSAPLEEAERLFETIQGGADVAIGSRWLERSRQTIHQPLYRQYFGRCFNLVTRSVMRLPFADTQCGFKAFRRGAARTIFQLQRIDRWGFDAEILFIASRRGYSVQEVPVTWGHDERSRISYLRDGIKMLQDIVYVRWNSFLGIYDRKVNDIAVPEQG